MSTTNDIILEGASGGRDDNRVCSFTVPYLAKNIGELLTVGGGAYHGLMETGRAWQAIDDGSGGYIVTVQYKGYTEDEEPDPEETEQWSLDFDFAEEPIESHPKIADIKAKYGAYYEESGGPLRFSETMPKGAKSSSGLSGKGKLKAGDHNPMHGVSTYAVMTARVTRVWSSRNIPANAVNDIGRVYENIPDAPNGINKIDFGDRNWMAMPPKIAQNGDVWRIQNEWMLSAVGGWVEEVYEKASKQ